MTDHYAQRLPYKPRDLTAAMGDYLLARTSFDRAGLDPLAVELVEHDKASLLDLAATLAGTPPGTTGLELTRTLQVGDFAESFTDGLARPLVLGYGQAAEHTAALYDMPVANFRPVALPVIDLGELDGPGGPLNTQPVVEAVSGVSGRPYTWGCKLLFGRPLLVNDDVGAITAIMTSLGEICAATEAAELARVLVANDPLGDGTDLFSGDNALSGGLDVAGLNAAFNALRTQPTPAGRKANMAAAVLLVPPDEIATALTLNTALGEPLKVVSNAALPSGTRYVMAAPGVSRFAAVAPTCSNMRPTVDRSRVPGATVYAVGVLSRRRHRRRLPDRAGPAHVIKRSLAGGRGEGFPRPG